MVGFEALLRTGELFTPTVGNIRFEKDSNADVIQLLGTKTGQRYGADHLAFDVDRKSVKG